MGLIKDFVQEWRDGWEERSENRQWSRLVGGLLLLCVLLNVGFGLWWSGEPETVISQRQVERERSDVVGARVVESLLDVTATLLEKPGGFLSNDLLPPGVLLDNMPNWEYGVLIQCRDLARALRESFSRSQSQSSEDPDLSRAEPRLNFSNNSWALPATESEYKAAMDFLDDYLAKLKDTEKQGSQFYARADNLRYWLGVINSRLGSLSQRLSASVGRRAINTDLANDVAAQQSTAAERELHIKTPWLQIDDVFYEARGATWALIRFLKAAEHDFGSVLENKNARVSLRQIIRELEEAQKPVLSPVILNGTGFGLLANHSLVMASHISRANAALNELRDLLARG